MIYETNDQLARDYLKVSTRYAGDVRNQTHIRGLLETSDVNIPQYFSSHGNSLEGLKIKGIGKVTIHTLELILEEGVDRAIEIIDAEHIKGIRDDYKGRRPNVPGTRDSDPSWDNAVRRHES